MKSLGVMQVTDSLSFGGLEVMAVNLANSMAARGIRSHLCSSRASGPLRQRLASGVLHLDLKRKGLLDPGAIRNLVRFVRQQEIDIVHAHGTSVFLSSLAGLFLPRAKVIYHLHFGCMATDARFLWAYRLAALRVNGVIAVNQALLQWARERLNFSSGQAWYVPNFVIEPDGDPESLTLPGQAGKRLVCVANLRPEKDHLTLLEAMEQVLEVEPEATLILVGSDTDHAIRDRVQERIGQGALRGRVVLLGSRADSWSVLRACDVGVLSSISEGMPLAVLEYGLAGLPVVATSVGQVPELLHEGGAGLLVPPHQSAALADALLRLLRSPELRRTLGAALRDRVKANYGEPAVMSRIFAVYEAVLGRAFCAGMRCGTRGGQLQPERVPPLR